MVLKKVQQIFREIFDSDNLMITGETSSNDIPEWDSFSQILIIEMIEREFDIKMDLDEVFRIKSINDLIKIIESNQNKDKF